jgi:4-hydroxybenzoate polyprenyltransferase
MFAMHSHVFGEIMDIEPDRLSGRPTTATVVGPVTAKFVIMLFLAGEAGLVYAGFKDAWMAAFLLCGAVWFLLDATWLWRTRPYSTGQMRAFLLGWNLIALASMRWVWSTASLTH